MVKTSIGGFQVTKVRTFAGLAVIGSLIVFGLNMFAQSQSEPSAQRPAVEYRVTTIVTGKAMNPTPAQNAQQISKRARIGKEKTTVQTSKDNSFWVEKIDISGNGNLVDSEMLWDDSEKILYTYADTPFRCADGSPGDGDFLIATYGKNNPDKKPAGSGWWVASLDETECKAHTDAMFGCKFDASGKNTMCGVAELNEKTNELTIIDATTTVIQ
jgi:hypothetical protein